MGKTRFHSVVAFGVVAALIVGCGPDYGNRQEVSGTVKLKGALLDEGVIEFRPLSTEAAEGEAAPEGATKTGAMILNGVYTIPRDSGLIPGKYQVLITSGDGKTPENEGELPGPTGNIVSKDRIPPEYNVRTKQEVEVKSDQPNVFDYDIP